jgi:phosphohistidine swiveling domain-containing protein
MTGAFPSPSAVTIPPACEGWDEMYPHHVLFGPEQSALDDALFWFHDGLHFPEPLYPFDALVADRATLCLSQASSRLFVVPSSLGCEYRILNGYFYLSANSVTDEATLARRAELFAQRGGFYYRHWDELYAAWREKVDGATRELQSLEVPDLPEVEDESVVTTGRGFGSSHALLVAYDGLLEGMDRVWQYHFEFLNLGYGAYLVFYDLCRREFPTLPDQTIARMVSAIDVDVLRPDDELRRLALLAIELGISEPVKESRSESELRVALGRDEAVASWLAEFRDVQDPWFYFSFGNGFYHHHRSWVDDTSRPLATIGSYIRSRQSGNDIARPYDALAADRDRITAECRAALSEDARASFDRSLALARTVFPYVENHNFHIDHRYMTLFWNKTRAFGALLARNAFLHEQEDVFFLRHEEVRLALEELRLVWSTGGAGVARGTSYWPTIVARRKSIYEAMRQWAPPPALGRAPESITEPMTIMLWGITDERVNEWLAQAASRDRTLSGFAASPGLAEATARVLLDVGQMGELQDGEILVAPSTSTSWTPVFHRIAAVVTDTGGIMCHAAIVAREYGLPAVVGTGSATKRIETGDRLHVDANAGSVTIIERR